MSRADVLGCAFVTAPVPLPGGKSVVVREMSAGERAKFFALTKEGKDLAELQAWLVAWCVVEGEGRAFSDADVPELTKRPSRVLQPIADASLKLSGLSEGDEKKE